MRVLGICYIIYAVLLCLKFAGILLQEHSKDQKRTAHIRPYSWPKCQVGMQTARQLGTVHVTQLLQEHVNSNHLFQLSLG